MGECNARCHWRSSRSAYHYTTRSYNMLSRGCVERRYILWDWVESSVGHPSPKVDEVADKGILQGEYCTVSKDPQL